jgi:hypothetical protein
MYSVCEERKDHCVDEKKRKYSTIDKNKSLGLKGLPHLDIKWNALKQCLGEKADVWLNVEGGA